MPVRRSAYFYPRRRDAVEGRGEGRINRERESAGKIYIYVCIYICVCRIIETRRWCVTFVTRINIIVEAESERMNVPRQESIAARNMQTKLHFATASFDRAPRSLLRERERESLMTNIRKQREAPVINIRPFDGRKEAVREDELTYRAKGWIEKSSAKKFVRTIPFMKFWIRLVD